MIIMSCMRKHKFDSDKSELSDKKMAAVLTDVLLMEAYVSEKMQGANFDSIAIVKKSFYKPILDKHKVDSAVFYEAFTYYHAHPKEFSVLLNMVDSTLNKVHGKDTAFVKPMVTVPENIEALSSFKDQEKAMREEFLKDNDTLKNERKSFRERIQKK